MLTHEMQKLPALEQISQLQHKKLIELKSLIIVDLESKIKRSIESSIRQEISSAIAEVTNRTNVLSLQQNSLKKEIDVLSAKISVLEHDKKKITSEIKNRHTNNRILYT